MPPEVSKERFARQWKLAGWSEEAQARLLAARALVVGAGGLGSPAIYYLAAAGVGNITIADGDIVELSNLNRQILHTSKDVGRPKVDSAAEKIKAFFPECNIEVVNAAVTPKNAAGLFEGKDVTLDCTDGFPNKYLLNDTAVATGTPLIHAGVLGWSGQIMTVSGGNGPCLRCIFPSPPPDDKAPSSRTMGILGAVAGTMGAMQALEAVKIVTGLGEPLVGRMMTFDGLSMQAQTLKIVEDENCRACGMSKSV